MQAKQWEIGDLPPGPCSYIKFPTYKPHSVTVTRGRGPPVTVTSTARHEPREPTEWTYMSREMWRDPDKRARHEEHHKEGKGWRSRWHPKVLDYRTVDELGLPIKTLDDERLPRTQAAKQYAEQVVDNLLVEGEELLVEQGILVTPSILLQPNKPVYGEIKPAPKKKETQFVFYKINVPDRDIPVGLRVTVTSLTGDPDVYICNRNTFPMQHPHEHTWKSQHAGDDTILVPPHDPSFFPGMFFISVFALRETTYEITATFEQQVVRIRAPMNSEGNGYREVRQQLNLADTRRRFCKNGVGFKEQLDSPRSLKGSPAPSPRMRPTHSRRSDDDAAPMAPRPPNSARSSMSAARPQTAPGPAAASPHPGLAKALGGTPSAQPGTGAMGFAAASQAHPTPQPPPAVNTGGASTSAGPPSVAALPLATRQALLKRTVRAATPRSRPDSMFRESERSTGEGDGSGHSGDAYPPGSPRSAALRPYTAPDGTPRSARLAKQFEESTERSPSPKEKEQEKRAMMRRGSERGSTKTGSQSARAAAARRSSSPTSAVASALGALRGRRSPVNQEEEDSLTDAQKLERFDEGGEVYDTVVAFIAAQANVSAEVISSRGRVPMEERVSLAKGEFNGVQNLLTQRLRQTLTAQDAARINAYRFRAKAAQHLDLETAGNWSPERALALLTSESLKMKEAYDVNLSQYIDEIVHRQEEARNAQERSAARQRIRAAFGGATAGVRMMRAVRATKAMGAGGGNSPKRESIGGRRASNKGGPGARQSRERLASFAGGS